MNQLIRDKTKLNIRAVIKPETVNPGTIAATSLIIKVLMTKVNKPRVSMVIGRFFQ